MTKDVRITRQTRHTYKLIPGERPLELAGTLSAGQLHQLGAIAEKVAWDASRSGPGGRSAELTDVIAYEVAAAVLNQVMTWSRQNHAYEGYRYFYQPAPTPLPDKGTRCEVVGFERERFRSYYYREVVGEEFERLQRWSNSESRWILAIPRHRDDSKLLPFNPNDLPEHITQESAP